jgi:PadR family transcriptional regulator
MVVECLLPMRENASDPDRIDLLQGTLDMLILRTLQWGPQHGHGIGVAIRQSSDDLLQIDHGSLYPALHRLERQKWIAAEWKQTENKQRAKYYRLTPAGKKQLALARSRWKRMVNVIARVMRPA